MTEEEIANTSPSPTQEEEVAVVELVESTIRYESAFLLALKDSPLVGKPEGMVWEFPPHL
jgi:hypothetical protein